MRTTGRALLLGIALVALAGYAGAEEPPPAGPKTEPAAPAAPAAPAKREVKDGKLTDPYWGLVYEAEGLKETMGFGSQGQIFSGECGDGVKVEILVGEAPKEVTAAEWLKAMGEAWKKQGRKMTEVEEAAGEIPTVMFVEQSLAGFQRHHGYSFFARGLQGFQVHVTVSEKSETSGAAIKARLGGLRLGADTGASLLAAVVAKSASLPPSNLKVRLDAGMGYLSDQVNNPAMGYRVLQAVLRDVKEGALDADETWYLHEYLGLAALMSGKPEEAIDWLKKSEALSPKATEKAAKDGQSTYNLACAYARAGKTDLAFETLARCRKLPGWVEFSGLLPTDTDLDSLRADPRWKGLTESPQEEPK